jgi:hypothetical protein
MGNLSRHFMIALALACGPCAMALEPCTAGNSDYAFVERAVDASSGPDAIAAITTLPSFRPQYAVRVFKDSVTLVRFQSSIWGELASDGISPEKGSQVWKAPISSELATRVAEVLARYITAARPVLDSGRDGVTYLFSIPGKGCASAWSPVAESRDWRLVQLAKALEIHAQADGKQALVASEQEIINALDVL